jgi:hypothetical protein
MSIEFKRTLVYQPYILEAVLGARLSYGSGSLSDSYITEGDDIEPPAVIIGSEDQKLIRKLVRAGGGEDKLLRCIPVSVVIKAPLRWWVDMDTYKVGTVKQSASLMHFLKRNGHFTAGQFTDTTDPRLIDIANEKFDAWVAAGAKRNYTSKEWEELQDAISRGYLYTAQWFGSYAVLRNIYFQRRHHRQGEFREFCRWIEGLPQSWMITLEKGQEEER